MLHVVLASVALPIFLQLSAASGPSDRTAREDEGRRVLHLKEAVDYAMAHQPAIRQARAQTVVADSQTGTAEAGLFPQLTLTASYQRVRTAAIGSRATSGGSGATGGTGSGVNTVPIGSTGESGVNVFSFGGNVSLMLWDFGQTYDRFRAAKTRTASLEATERTTTQSVLGSVRRAYFVARAQRELVGVAKDTFENLRLHLAQVEGSVKVGTRPEIDLAQARTDLANARVSVIEAENNYAVAKAQLATAAGLERSDDFDVADDELPAVDGEDAPVDRLLPDALGRRPELVALDRQRDAFDLDAKSARGGYGPTLTASGGASKVGTDLGSLGTAWNVGVFLAWPIFQGGVTRAQVREAEANRSVAEAQIDAQRLQIRLDIEQALVVLRAAKATQEATGEALVAARERLRLAEGRYVSGVGNAVELGDAQVAATTAAASVVQAKFNVSAARADLLTALGKR